MRGDWFCAAFIFLLSLGLCNIYGTDLCPWFGKDLQWESRANCLVQSYHSVDTGHGTKHRPACDVFLDLNTSLALLGEWSLEVEAVAADTRHRSFGMDSLLLTGRYRWLNDIVADPVTLVTGLTVSKVFKPARHDIAIFHHGGIQCEVHAAAGKEYSCEQFWTTRFWGVCGIGIADLGSPWVRGDAAIEHNWWDRHQMKIALHTLWGLGHNNLSFPFKGYGPIHHQSVDALMRYTYAFESSLELSLEYGYRVFAHNCPKNVNLFLVQLFYPFAL